MILKVPNWQPVSAFMSEHEVTMAITTRLSTTSKAAWGQRLNLAINLSNRNKTGDYIC